MTAPVLIARLRAPSREEFLRELWEPGRPGILEGLLEGWPASAWTVESLGRRLGTKEVVVATSHDTVFHADPDVPGRRNAPEAMPFSRLVAHVSKPGSVRYYLQQASLRKVLPELGPDVSLFPYRDEAQLADVNLWLGPAGNVSWCHFDLADNFLAQVRGRKRISLFAPEDFFSLYAYPVESVGANHMSQVDIDAPDLAKFPAFARARRIDVILEPGEVLFMPALWWHQVYSLEAGISVNMFYKPHISKCLMPAVFRLLPALCDQPDALDANVDTVGVGGLYELAALTLDKACPPAVSVVLARAALIQHLRRLCVKKGVSTVNARQGSSVKRLAQRLTAAGFWPEEEGRRIETWLDQTQSVLGAVKEASAAAPDGAARAALAFVDDLRGRYAA